jgi:hypothetical protein
MRYFVKDLREEPKIPVSNLQARRFEMSEARAPCNWKAVYRDMVMRKTMRYDLDEDEICDWVGWILLYRTSLFRIGIGRGSLMSEKGSKKRANSSYLSHRGKQEWTRIDQSRAKRERGLGRTPRQNPGRREICREWRRCKIPASRAWCARARQYRQSC